MYNKKHFYNQYFTFNTGLITYVYTGGYTDSHLTYGIKVYTSPLSIFGDSFLYEFNIRGSLIFTPSVVGSLGVL